MSTSKISYLTNTVEDSDHEEQKELSGIAAILNSSIFSSKASNIYIKQVPSYLDAEHPPSIRKQINELDANILYSLNIASLWLLLKDKLKKLSNIHLFKHLSDKIIIKFSLIFGSNMSLNDAKKKLIEKQSEMLRRDLKGYIQNKIKKEEKRRSLMIIQFDNSLFFNKEAVQRLQLNNLEKKQLKKQLSQFKLKKNPVLIRYLQRVLSKIQKQIQVKDSDICERNKASLIQVDSTARQAYGTLFLCTYLNLYLGFSDWVNFLLKDKEKVLNQLLFIHLARANGFQVINRVLEDAPLSVLVREITAIQQIYYE